MINRLFRAFTPSCATLCATSSSAVGARCALRLALLFVLSGATYSAPSWSQQTQLQSTDSQPTDLQPTLTPADDSSWFSHQAHEVQVGTGIVHLHTGPGRGYPITLSLVKGERLTLLKTRGNWVQVQSRQQQLWLNDDDLTKLQWQNGAPYVTEQQGALAYQQRDIEVSAMFGDLNGASFYQLELGYRFSSVVSVGLSAGQANGDNATTQIAEAHVYLDPFAHWLVSPYLGIGGGVNRTVPRTILVQSLDRTDAIASAEVGMRYYLARNFIARAAYHRGVLATSRNENDEITTWKLGVSVFF